MSPLTIKLEPWTLSDDQFYQLCQNNRDLRFERNRQGDLMIMPPTGGETGNRNAKIIVKLGIWTEQNGTGIFFDSSTGFKLPNGADKSPDAAWIALEKWNGLTIEERQGFVPLCPDFVIELRSKSDNLKVLQEKMQEYLENGTRLGWLINRQDRQVEIYRQGQGLVSLFIRAPDLDFLKPLCSKAQFFIFNSARKIRDTNGQGVEVLENPNSLSGENILPSFVLDLGPIW